MGRVHLIGGAVAALLATSSVGAATRLVEDGVLRGLRGLDVAGTTYRVTFVDAVLADVFDDGAGGLAFDFDGEDAGLAAAQALAAALEGSPFENDPAAIFGLDDTNFTFEGMVIPYALNEFGNISAALVSVSADPAREIRVGQSPNYTTPATDFDNLGFAVLADFERVPLPASGWLMLGGLGLLLARRRRARPQGQVATGGSDISTASGLCPVSRPKRVPRS